MLAGSTISTGTMTMTTTGMGTMTGRALPGASEARVS